MVCTIDLATSLANHLGVAIPADACLDSLDVMGALLGRDGAAGRARLIEQDNGTRGNYGYRAGQWKLQRHAPRQPKKGEQASAVAAAPRYMLYDLENDPGEKQDVAGQHVKVFERMQAELQQMIDAGRTRPAATVSP